MYPFHSDTDLVMLLVSVHGIWAEVTMSTPNRNVKNHHNFLCLFSLCHTSEIVAILLAQLVHKYTLQNYTFSNVFTSLLFGYCCHFQVFSPSPFYISNEKEGLHQEIFHRTSIYRMLTLYYLIWTMQRENWGASVLGPLREK